MSAIDDLKDRKVAMGDWLTQAQAILELDARLKRLEGNQNQFDPLMPIKMPPIDAKPIQRTTRVNAHMEQNTCNIPTTTPTDEELIAKYKEPLINVVKLMIDPETLLRQLIAEVRKGDKP